jgi:glycosyltransferase involved in cell wall biosynthesis
MSTPAATSFEKAAAATTARLRIVINGRFLTQTVTGVQRYAIELTKALDELLGRGVIDAERYKFELLAPLSGAADLSLRHIQIRRQGNLSGSLWEQFELPWLTRDALLINLCNAAPLAVSRQLVTLHDAAVHAVPEAYSRAFRIWYKLLLPNVGRIARRVITVSQFSRSEITRRFGVAESKCVVIGEGKEHMQKVAADKSALERHGIGRRPYVLAVSSASPNKNFRAIVQAIQWLGAAPFDLVIAGGTNPRIFSDAGAKLPDFVRHVGYVSDGELKALYEAAACFVYPSFYEGFGLPPLEAMACGCPVIVSRAASLPEVCGDAALYCDPTDPRDIAKQMSDLVFDDGLRARLRQRGLERAQQFSWERCARETWAVIEEEAGA